MLTCNKGWLGDGAVAFPDFNKILDFTSVGGESSVDVNVDGDTDKEYKMVIRSTSTSASVLININSASTSIYGRQYLYNVSGSLSATRDTTNFTALLLLSEGDGTLLTPTGFQKTIFFSSGKRISGTTMAEYYTYCGTWNTTSNVTSINFTMASPENFVTGTRIIVYARKVNT